MTTPYAVTRKRTPTTGDPLMDGNEWERATAPMSEVVAMTMRTQAGACAVDVGLGVDWNAVNKLQTGAEATARYVIEKALARYVAAGLITKPLVTATIAGNWLVWSVTYTDPRDTASRPRTITGAV